jgi:hypothetical protein
VNALAALVRRRAREQASVIMASVEGDGGAGIQSSSIPSVVSALTDCFLTAADSIVPGFVQGLYLTGSVALNDFRSHCSDVDFVAGSGHRPDHAELRGLAAVHGMVRRIYPRLHFDGTHLSWSDLSAGPGACMPAPFTHEGRFELSGRFAIDPVTWHELGAHGLAVRGPSIAGVQVWRDGAVLRAWTLNNLVEYWRPWIAQYREGPSSLERRHDLVCWGVLGVARLHYTVATNRITSKTAAGQYALEVFDRRWGPIVSEAIGLRADPTKASDYADLSQRRLEVLAFMSTAIESALRTGAL